MVWLTSCKCRSSASAIQNLPHRDSRSAHPVGDRPELAHPATAFPGPTGERVGLLRPAGPGSGNLAGPDLDLLPTPAVNDMGAGKTEEEWAAFNKRLDD